MKRWFFSYVQVYARGVMQFGNHVCNGDEHPLTVVKRWNSTYGKQDGFTIAVLAFHEVGPEVPDYDVLTHHIP